MHGFVSFVFFFMLPDEERLSAAQVAQKSMSALMRIVCDWGDRPEIQPGSVLHFRHSGSIFFAWTLLCLSRRILYVHLCIRLHTHTCPWFCSRVFYICGTRWSVFDVHLCLFLSWCHRRHRGIVDCNANRTLLFFVSGGHVCFLS